MLVTATTAATIPAEATNHDGERPWVERTSHPWTITHGLQGQHIGVWASHGRYFNVKKGWQWQRPALFCTTEDLLTPSFVYPFLIPMLENAGAVVWTPRERDSQPYCVVADTPTDSTAEHYLWELPVPAEGRYAVYVYYPQNPQATQRANYTIVHGGVDTGVAVSQRIGSENWTYLGTFPFRNAAKITLQRNANDGIVMPGRIRLGGGIGHLERTIGVADSICLSTDSIHEPHTSGVLHYLEAARYYAQSSGLPAHLYDTEYGLNDYNDDLRIRSNWLNWLREEKNVPLTLNLAVHTDAGFRTDSIPYGPLAICTTRDEHGCTVYPDSTARSTSTELCRLLLDNICRDLSDLNWKERELRDRNYSETRAPHIPSAIIELLSHQNFLDTRYAHDPNFKFRICRALYKALLRYTYKQQGKENPIVQPLPVQKFAAILDAHDDEVHLTWEATPDTLEPTAKPERYILYTKMDDGDFDNGRIVRSNHTRQSIIPGHVYTYRVTAVNEGGESFPSNQLSVYRSPLHNNDKTYTPRHVILVDAFTRLSGPAYIETPDSIGYLLDADCGVPYGETLEYCGRQINFNPKRIGHEGPNALGYSGDEMVGQLVTGNFFDTAARKAMELSKQADPICLSSISVDAVEQKLPQIYRQRISDWPHLLYWLAGRQRRANHNMQDYPVWPAAARPAVEQAIGYGTQLVVEGQYVAPSLLSEEERTWWDNMTHNIPNKTN